MMEVDSGDAEYDHIAQTIKQRAAILKKLDISNVLFPFKKIHQAFEAIPNPQMLELRLSSCKLISIECDLLAKSPATRHLRSLDLSCNTIKL